MTAMDILQDVWKHPGSSAREITERIYGDGRTRSYGRGRVTPALRVLAELGLVDARPVEPRHANDTPFVRYWPGKRELSVEVAS